MTIFIKKQKKHRPQIESTGIAHTTDLDEIPYNIYTRQNNLDTDHIDTPCPRMHVDDVV